MKIKGLFLGLVLALAAEAGVAAPGWIRINSPHFELFTNAGERSGRRTILYFEQIRDFFRQTANLGKVPSFPVRIIQFRSQREFAPFRSNETATAYHLSGLKRETVAMGTSDRPTRMAAVHEFIHLLVKHSGAELPLWLEEGLASLFSTLEPQGRQVRFGEMASDLLRDRQWLPFRELIAVDRNSSHYDESDRTKVFYAQSWALTHMICRSRQYRQRFSNFLTGVVGDTGEEAFRWVHGKSLDQIEIDFKRYVVQKKFPAGLYEIRLKKTAEKPKVHPATATEVSLVKADLLVRLKKPEQAREIYSELARQDPEDWQVPEALGYLASYSGDLDQARRHFARAIELEATNPKVYYDYSLLLRDADAEPETVKAVLRKAISLKPDYDDGHYLLGSILLQEGERGMALAQMMRVKQLSRQEAVPFYRTVAELNHQLGKKEAARRAAILCHKYAQSSEEVASAEELLEWLDVPVEKLPDAGSNAEADVAAAAPDEPPSVPPGTGPGQSGAGPFEGPDPPDALRQATVEGTFTKLDCLGEHARLYLLVEGKPLALAILDAASVRVTGPEAGLVDLSCGEQESKPVVVEYQPKDDAELGTLGIVKVIQFQ